MNVSSERRMLRQAPEGGVPWVRATPLPTFRRSRLAAQATTAAAIPASGALGPLGGFSDASPGESLPLRLLLLAVHRMV